MIRRHSSTRASSRSGSTRRAPRWPSSSRSTPTPRGTRKLRTWRSPRNGDFVVLWSGGSDRDGDAYGVFGQRFAGVEPTAATLDVDADGVVDALVDGLLILRRLFAFSGSTLTSGALGAGCTRCDAGDIAGYVDGLGMTLDVDDNDDVDARTDGLLILRRLFGFSGSTLVTGALGTGCERCDPGDIADYVDGLSM